MSEGNVYLCRWRKKGRRFTISLKRDPKIHASGDTFDEAEEEMWDVLPDRFGDGEAVVEYVAARPPAAESFAQHYGVPELVILGGKWAGKLLNAEAVHPKGIVEIAGGRSKRRRKSRRSSTGCPHPTSPSAHFSAACSQTSSFNLDP